MNPTSLSLILLLGVGFISCESKPNTPSKQTIINVYAANALRTYEDALGDAESLKQSLASFTSDPSDAKLTEAKNAWLKSRESYGQTEVYRFYDGPIDNAENGPEGFINAWPLDEAFIDYVELVPDAGIINQTGEYPTLTEELIRSKNEDGSEENIATGYHAIEFLLWGQDKNTQGPGNRPVTDYTTHPNAQRRKQYLTIVSDMLVRDLQSVRDAWKDENGTYRMMFEDRSSDEALKDILYAMGTLSGGELAGERMEVAYLIADQEHEHSCFSDNTHRDIIANALAVENIYYGRYKDTAGVIHDGVGLDELLRSTNPGLATKLEGEFAASKIAVETIPVPFDRALGSTEGRPKILEAVNALKAEALTIFDAARALGIMVQPDEP